MSTSSQLVMSIIPKSDLITILSKKFLALENDSSTGIIIGAESMSGRYVEATSTSIIPHSDHIETFKKIIIKFSFCKNLGVFFIYLFCLFTQFKRI
jgi:hypothetical protein